MKTFATFFLLAVVLAPMRAVALPLGVPSAEITISEDKTEMFTQNPIAFIVKNFNLKEHPSFLASDGNNDFQVSFRCSKGSVKALYDSKGELVSTKLNFRNISVPTAIMAEIFRDYKGWEVTDIRYRASSRGDILTRENYLIKLEKDGEVVSLKKRLA